MGHGRFVLFYLLCGTAAALGQSLTAPASTVPMVGASGAIAGVLGAYLLLHPRARINVLIVVFVFFRRIQLSALVVLGAWFALQFVNGLLAPVGRGGVAFWAHVAGFVAGMVLVPFFRRPGVPMLDMRPPMPEAPPFVIERRRPGPWDRR